MIIEPLFPTPVGFFELDRELTKKELDFIIKQERRPNMGNATSADYNVLEKAPLKSLRKFVEDCVSEYFHATIAPKNDVKLRLTQSWCNYTEPGEYHHKHAHPNSVISGVFYPQADKENDKIYFYREGYQQIKIPTEKWNPFNSESWWFQAYTGRLVLFPSSTTHMVEMINHDKTRISIAFNTFPVGNVGQDDSLTGLYL